MFRKSILWKMVLGLSCIFLLGGIFLYWMVDSQVEQSRTDQIVRDLNSLKANSQVYIRQMLILDGHNNNEESYRLVAEDIVGELYQIGGSHVAAYSLDGQLLYASKWELFEGARREDLERALQGKAAFTTDYPEQDQMIVTFSTPVAVAERVVGILRFWVDYSSLYRQGRETTDLVVQSCMVVFGLIFAVTLLLVSGILRPVKRLSDISRRVTAGLKEEQVDPAALDSLAETDRSDEVGQLAGDMESMLCLLQEQFDGMKADKAHILELLKSRQDFYNNVTHELKTPLTVIQGYSELLVSAGEDPALREKAVGHIRNESDRLYKMVLQLLEMAQRHHIGEKKPVELGSLIAGLTDAMGLRAQRYGMTFQVELEPNLWVLGEEERIRPVFVNLFDNAIKYGEKGSQIRISGGWMMTDEVEHGSEAERVAKSERETMEEGKICLRISNRGFLSERDQEKIFEPFYRVSKEVSREMGSAGLGLSLCRQLMEEQDGQIEATYEEEQVVFTLIFGNGMAGKKEGEVVYEAE